MQINDDVLAVLSASAVEGNKLFLIGQLDRKLYLATNKVLEAAGGKWNRKEKAHVFDHDAAERIDQIILSGEVEIPKDEFNYFPTPVDIVKQLILLADIDAGMLVLEPSAGKGAIASEIAKLGASVECYELMEDNFNDLAQNKLFSKVVKGDFLSIAPEPVYDRVVMNPPFTKQQDIKHVMHAHQFLKPGGHLVAIMSAGILFRENKLTKEFRQFVERNDGVIEPLPDGAFKPSGTMVRTVITTIEKE